MTTRRPTLLAAGAALLAALVAGCATVTHDTVYDASSEEAFAVVAAEGLPVSESRKSHFTFEMVDLDAQAFLGSLMVVRFGPIERMLNGEEGLSLDSDELMRPFRLAARDVRFAGAFVEPGDYALLFRHDVTEIGEFSSDSTICFASETNVFRLAPGTVNVIALGELRGAGDTDRERAVRDVAAVLEDYPGITAPIELAEVVEAVTYERDVTWRGESCRGAGDAFTPIAAADGDAAGVAGSR